MVDATGLLHTRTKNEGDISLRQGIGPEPLATSRESKGPCVSTKPFEILDDYANKVVEEPEVTTGFAFETRHRSYVREISIWRIFQDDGSKAAYRDEQGYCYCWGSMPPMLSYR